MTIKELQKLCHRHAVEKGFWGIPPGTIFEDNDEIFADWSKQERNDGELLMLIVSELGEALEALRKNRRQKGNVWKKDTFEDELADTVIRIFDMAEARGVKLEWQIKKKMQYNRKRPLKHGKEF